MLGFCEIFCYVCRKKGLHSFKGVNNEANPLYVLWACNRCRTITVMSKKNCKTLKNLYPGLGNTLNCLNNKII